MSGCELEQLISHPSTTHQNLVHAETENAHVSDDTVAALSSTKNHTGWTPFYLRTTTLVGFIILYIVLLLMVVALAAADAKHNGISTAKNSEHYLWSFGPTAGTHALNLFAD